MRILCVMGILAATGLLLQTRPSPAQPRQTPVLQLDEKSYGAGFFIGEETRSGLGHDGMGVDLDLVTRGFRDGLTNATPLVTRQDMNELLLALHDEMEKRMVQRLLEESPIFKQLHDENLRKSRAFHEVFQKQPGVETLPSGLQYKVLRSGTGRSPTASDVVVATARMTLLDGAVLLDEEAAQFSVDQTTVGGQELLQRMRVGARWQVAVPPALAHGAAGRFPDIGPNETMVGIVELLEIK